MISTKYHPYKKPSIDVLLPFQCMWDSYPSHIIVSIHRIEVCHPGTAPEHSAPYQARLKSREFEKAKINKVLAESIIKPVRTDQQSPIVFVPKRDRTLRLCVDYRKLVSVTK